MATSLKHIRRKRYRLQHPERLLLALAILAVLILALVLLLRKGPAEEPAESQESLSLIEESRDPEATDNPKATVGLGEIKTQIQGALQGILADNRENYAKAPESQPEESWQTPEYTYCLALDAGHGGDDPGNIQGETLEKDINLAVALLVRDYIQKTDPDVKVCITRTGDYGIDGRRALVDSFNPDMVVSLHCNAFGGPGTARGTEAMYWTAGDDDEIGKLSFEAAVKLIAATAEGFGLRQRSPILGSNTLLNNSPVPAVLIEMGFLSDEQDDAALNDPQLQEQGAASIGQAILELLYTYPSKNNPEDGHQTNDSQAADSEPAGE